MNNGVCAVIVTYNRKHTLQKCLTHVRNLSVKPDKTVIVDNASSDGTAEFVRTHFPEFELIVLLDNNGGAGGFDAGMRYAYEQGYEYVWLFDDDAYVHEDCLKILLEYADQGDVLLARQVDQTGRGYGIYTWEGTTIRPLTANEREVDVFTFVGPLIKRSVIERCGFPRVDFFLCADDTEYSLRIKHAGLRSTYVPEAFFWHDYGGQTVKVKRLGRESIRSSEPAWKKYYGVRNELLIVRSFHQQTQVRRRYLLTVTKKLLRLAAGELLYTRDFPERLWYSALGVRDGVLNRTGKRVKPVVKKQLPSNPNRTG